MKLPPAEVIREHVLAMPQVREGCEFVAREVERDARELAYERAFDSGEFAHGITTVPDSPGALVRATDRKSRWLEDGTGIYGPRRQPIRPKKGKFLVFRVQGGAPLASMGGTRSASGLIFARQVKGRPASHVMRDASRLTAARLGLRWRDLTL